METTRTEINNEFKDKEIKFSVKWDCLTNTTIMSQKPPECSHCGFVSPSNPCVFCGAQCQPGVFTNNVAIYEISKGTEGEPIATRVYCVDVSGSMEGDRIQYVSSKIIKELEEYKIYHPNNKVCLITFDSDCYIIGDGSHNQIEVDHDSSYDELIAVASKHKDLLPISDSFEMLKEKVLGIECLGATASVSALALATEYAAYTGGEVFFFTDGNRTIGLPSSGNVDQIVERAKEGNGVLINLSYFKNSIANIDEYAACALNTGGSIDSFDWTEGRQRGAAIKRSYVAYDVKVTSIMSDGITKESEDITIDKVTNADNHPLKFIVPLNSTARTQPQNGENLYAQCKVEYRTINGSIMKAYINGIVKVVATVDKEDTREVIAQTLNEIYELVRNDKFEEAEKKLESLLKKNFRIGADLHDTLKQSFTELLKYLRQARRNPKKKR